MAGGCGGPDFATTKEPPVSPVLPGAFVTLATTVPIYSSADGMSRTVTLEEGALLQVLDVGVTGLVKIQYPDPVEGSLVGWAQLGTPAAPLVEPAILAGCPPSPSIGLLVGLSEGERLRCYRGRELVFRSVMFVDAPGGSIYAGTPAWLAEVPAIDIAEQPDSERFGVHVPPEMAWPAEGSLWNVSGRFSDDRSSNCRRRAIDAGAPEVQPEDAVLWCRQQFVITSASPAAPGVPATIAPDVDGP